MGVGGGGRRGVGGGGGDRSRQVCRRRWRCRTMSRRGE